MGIFFLLPFSQGALGMGSASYYGILLFDTASYFSRHKELTQLFHLSVAMTCCTVTTSKTWLAVVSSKQSKKNKISSTFWTHWITHLYSMERKLDLLGLNPQNFFSIRDKPLSAFLINRKKGLLVYLFSFQKFNWHNVSTFWQSEEIDLETLSILGVTEQVAIHLLW